MSYKVRIPADTPERCVPDYLTIGKVYDAVEYARYDPECGLFTVEADDGGTLIIQPEHCAHIDWNAWEFI